ncbi:ABC transporter substrate-binding protein [Alteromonas lipolytica]|uniref:SsuA/THI5-like domain-containing protein n=1 Tax=Alteromonas lipolytica TaxID=1856405 RepID=A0A1E8FJB5_9ALTE|nr:ABC transporter substrate-binding protein [Alteromonas lipolytica]OFI36027.1 hypothetical protein BFC17_10135 [Alteromonas lipolytica]GGF71573.1 twin-arginine translocation pathway signal protein [Alteromonas lipolytica]
MKKGWALFLVGWLWITPSVAKDNVVFQLDWLPGGDKSPVYVGIEQGFFSAQNIEVKVLTGRGSTDSITRVAAGRAHFGFADIGTLMAAKAQSPVPVVAIHPYFTEAPHAFYVLSDSPVTRISDLKGKKVATSAFTSSNAFLPLVLAQHQMQEKDLTLIKANVGALGPMMLSGNVDAIIAWVTNLGLYKQQAMSAGKTLRILPWSESGLSLYSSSVIASERLLASNPDLVKRFAKAMHQAIEFAYHQAEQAGKDIHQQVPEVDAVIAKEQIEATYPLVFNAITERDGFGVFTKAYLATTWKYVAKANNLTEDSLDAESAVASFAFAGAAE